MKLHTILIALLTNTLASSQNVKIDSIFNYNFHIIEIEIKKNKHFENEKELYDEVNLNNGQKVYINKNLPQAISFFEKTSKIKAPRKHSGQSIIPFINKKILRDWRNWYIINKKRIKWDKENNEVQLLHSF